MLFIEGYSALLERHFIIMDIQAINQIATVGNKILLEL